MSRKTTRKIQMDDKKFFALTKAGILGPKLEQGEIDGCNAIIAAFAGQPIAFVAYALGTAYLETASTMRPVREANWLSTAAANRYFFRMYDIEGERPKKARELGNLRPGDGVLFCGRGFPQVTGGNNYRLAAKIFGIPFDTKPDIMMQPEPAAKVMAHFMIHGLFTGISLDDALPKHGLASTAQFIKGRPIINGKDRDDDVAAFAICFQTALQAAGYGK